MATKVIDFIQSEQITRLEQDVNILKNALNLLVADINIIAPKLTPIVSNKNAVADSISKNYSPSGNTSGDGLLKKLTGFDDDYTTHISRKMPPVVDLKGMPHIGFHTGGTAIEHAHPEGWYARTGTCMTATVTMNNVPAYYYNLGQQYVSNVKFVPKSTSNWPVPSNQTWEGLQVWWALPTAAIWFNHSTSPPTISYTDFRLEGILGGPIQNANCSFGYGWSVNDEMMSTSGASNGGSTNAFFHATVTSVGTQLEPLPPDNAVQQNYQGFIGRTPHDPLSAGNWGDPSPGQGGIPEPADWGEGGSHHIMDESNQLDDQQFITTVLNTGVVPSYLNQAQILFMSDENKIKRAKQLIRMTRNKLRDDSIWQTENVSDGVLTADDFIT